MLNKHLSPKVMGGFGFRQQKQFVLKQTCSCISFLRSQAEAVVLYWACAGVPEFAEILRCVT